MVVLRGKILWCTTSFNEFRSFYIQSFLEDRKPKKYATKSLKILSIHNSINSNSIPLLAWKILSFPR